MERPVLRNTTWNWLPAFLEVAESGSVAQASRQLGLTPPAVSRTIRLLEEHLGKPLFNRGGRTLILNPAGQRLRDSVRRAVQRVDRALGEVHADPFNVPLRVASLGVLTDHLVLPSLVGLKREHPALCPEHVVALAGDANRMLLHGRVDIAFYQEELSEEGLVVEQFGTSRSQVYCGREHPLFGSRRLEPEEVLEHGFAVPQRGHSGRVMDGWPSDIERRIGMRITRLHSALHVAESGALLAVLPDVVAAPHVEAGRLSVVPFPDLPPQPMLVAVRAESHAAPNVRALKDAVRARWEAMDERISQWRVDQEEGGSRSTTTSMPARA